MAKRKAKSRKSETFALPEFPIEETQDPLYLQKRIQGAIQKGRSLFRDITNERALQTIGIFLERGTDGYSEIYTDEGEKPFYLLLEKRLIGPKNLQRELTILFNSSEPEDNKELMHLLYGKTR
jgi:hypothetical protein